MKTGQWRHEDPLSVEVCVCISSRVCRHARGTAGSHRARLTTRVPLRPRVWNRCPSSSSAPAGCTPQKRKQRTAAAAPRRAVTTTRRIPRSGSLWSHTVKRLLKPLCAMARFAAAAAGRPRAQRGPARRRRPSRRERAQEARRSSHH